MLTFYIIMGIGIATVVAIIIYAVLTRNREVPPREDLANLENANPAYDGS